MESEEPTMIVPGFEDTGDVPRIYELLEQLKLGHEVQFFKTIDMPWTVVFKGDPSLRHANRISIFKEFLSDLMSTDLRVAAGQAGSVAVLLTAENRSIDFEVRSLELIKNKLLFENIAHVLGIEKITFSNSSSSLEF
jgi:hypothetical protein